MVLLLDLLDGTNSILLLLFTGLIKFLQLREREETLIFAESGLLHKHCDLVLLSLEASVLEREVLRVDQLLRQHCF